MYFINNQPSIYLTWISIGTNYSNLCSCNKLSMDSVIGDHRRIMVCEISATNRP